jgi:DNA modification methylase
MSSYEIKTGNAWTLVKENPQPIVQAIVTSPPYWKQRRYSGSNEEFGRGTLDEYVSQLGDLFESLKLWLTADGCAWLNIGDSYVDDQLQFVPQKSILAISERGWRIVSEVIYSKTNSTPRPTIGRPARYHEHVFLLTPNKPHYYNDALMTEKAKYAGYVLRRKPSDKNDGRIRLASENYVVPQHRAIRSVWTGRTGWNGLQHPALMPRMMAERCVLSISRPGDLVLDPFSGLASTGAVCIEHHRRYLGWELNPKFVDGSQERLSNIEPIIPYDNKLPVVKEAADIKIVDGNIRPHGWEPKPSKGGLEID